MSSLKPNLPVPTSSAGGNRGIHSSSSAGDMEDINHLLFLEAIKRYKDDEENIRSQIKEKERQYQEVKAEYLNVYKKYVSLTKASLTHTTLKRENGLNLSDRKIAAAENNIAHIIEKLATVNMTEYIDPESLEECKTNLQACKEYKNLIQLQGNVAHNKTIVNTINRVMENVECTFEASAIQGLDYFNDEMNPNPNEY